MKRISLKSTTALLAFGLISVNQANAFDSIPSYETNPSKGWEKTISVTIDDNMKKGSSDKDGDFKGLSYTLRKGHVVVAVEGTLTTPQSPNASRMRDTAHGKLTVGVEKNNWGVYASVGTTKGAVGEFMNNAVNIGHAMAGMADARTSPYTKTPDVTFHLAARRDYSFWQKDCGRVCFGTHVTAFGVLGNIETHAGVAAYAVMNIRSEKEVRHRKSPKFRPNIESMPTANIQGTNLYAGVRAKYVGLDAAIEGSSLNRKRAELVVGVEVKRKRVAYGIEYSRQLTSDYIGASRPAASKIMARVTWSF